MLHDNRIAYSRAAIRAVRCIEKSGRRSTSLTPEEETGLMRYTSHSRQDIRRHLATARNPIPKYREFMSN